MVQKQPYQILPKAIKSLVLTQWPASGLTVFFWCQEGMAAQQLVEGQTLQPKALSLSSWKEQSELQQPTAENPTPNGGHIQAGQGMSEIRCRCNSR